MNENIHSQLFLKNNSTVLALIFSSKYSFKSKVLLHRYHAVSSGVWICNFSYFLLPYRIVNVELSYLLGHNYRTDEIKYDTE